MKNLIKSKPAYFAFGMLAVTMVMFFIFSNSKISASNQDAAIMFEAETHDFGNVEAGILLEYSYKFTNEGDKPLVIERVQPSCGCTGATVGDKTEYAEGESGEIKITFNTQGREGYQEKHITVFTNDVGNPQKDLKFSCDIVKKNE